MKLILEYLKERFFSDERGNAVDLKDKASVRNAIASLCENYLKNVDDELIFEVVGKDLYYALDVVGVEPLTNRFEIYQIDNSLFIARLKGVDVF